jgi:hypothetical protein
VRPLASPRDAGKRRTLASGIAVTDLPGMEAMFSYAASFITGVELFADGGMAQTG